MTSKKNDKEAIKFIKYPGENIKLKNGVIGLVENSSIDLYFSQLFYVSFKSGHKQWVSEDMVENE